MKLHARMTPDPEVIDYVIVSRSPTTYSESGNQIRGQRVRLPSESSLFFNTGRPSPINRESRSISGRFRIADPFGIWAGQIRG
jgi:hypothetical protein